VLGLELDGCDGFAVADHRQGLVSDGRCRHRERQDDVGGRDDAHVEPARHLTLHGALLDVMGGR